MRVVCRGGVSLSAHWRFRESASLGWCRVVQPAAKIERHHFVGRAMALEQGAMVVLDAASEL